MARDGDAKRPKTANRPKTQTGWSISQSISHVSHDHVAGTRKVRLSELLEDEILDDDDEDDEDFDLAL